MPKSETEATARVTTRWGCPDSELPKRSLKKHPFLATFVQCGRMKHHSHRRQAVVAVLRSKDRLLVIKRAPGVILPGYWTPPSGRIEPGETHEQALIREVVEELGVKATPIAKVASKPASMFLTRMAALRASGSTTTRRTAGSAKQCSITAAKTCGEAGDGIAVRRPTSRCIPSPGLAAPGGPRAGIAGA